jgi:SP family arabinose:H+ symporter-like MFS transporter
VEQRLTYNKVVVVSTMVAALGGLLFGFDTAVIAGTTSALTSYFGLTEVGLGITVSCALWGTVAGGLFASIPAQRLGGRDSLRITALLYLISAIGCSLSQGWYSFLVFRLVSGIAIGGCSVFAPMYIAEVSPAAIRGKLVGCFQLSIVVGILVAYASNFALGNLQLGTNQWRADLGVAAIPSLLFFAALGFIPRSPRWLVLKGRLDEARQSLTAIGFNDPEAEVEEIRSKLRRGVEGATASIFAPIYRRPLLIALALGFFNQMSGINAVLYYLNDIFRHAGFGLISAQKQTIVVGIANLLFTLVGMSLIDRIGRKPLLLFGAACMAISLGAIASIFFSNRGQQYLLPLLVAFIASFAVSQGAVVWVYLSEIFPLSVRSSGQGFSSFWLWLLAAIVSGAFPVIAHASRGVVFSLFCLCMILQIVIVFLFFPETRGTTLETV